MPTGTLAPQARGHGRTKSRMRRRGFLKQCLIAGIINVWQRCDAWQGRDFEGLSHRDAFNGEDLVSFHLPNAFSCWIGFDLTVLDEC